MSIDVKICIIIFIFLYIFFIKVRKRLLFCFASFAALRESQIMYRRRIVRFYLRKAAKLAKKKGETKRDLMNSS